MIKKVAPNQNVTRNLSASALNKVFEAADHYHDRHALGVPLPGRRGLPNSLSLPVAANRLKVRNDSGGDLARGSVVGIGDMLLDPAETFDWWMEADVCTYGQATNYMKHGVLLEPIPDGDIGLAQIGGICPALVYFTNASDRNCMAVEGETVLQAGPGAGPIGIISKPVAGTGESLCLVMLAIAPPLCIGKTTEFIAKGSTGEVERYKASYGSETATGQVLQVKNKFADVNADTWCLYEGTEGVFYMVAGECTAY